MSALGPDEILGLIHATTDAADFSGCDLVIETAVEKEDVKRKIFHDLCITSIKCIRQRGVNYVKKIGRLTPIIPFIHIARRKIN